MPREFSRANRVADQVQRELGELIRELVQGSKLGLVTVTEVQVAPDLQHAYVFVSVIGGDAQAAVRVLSENAVMMRRALGRVMRLKRGAPQLHFKHDKIPAEAQRLTTIINHAVAEDRQHHPDET